MSLSSFAGSEPIKTDYWLHGLRVRSELPLDQCLSWRGPDRPVDIHVRLGKVADGVDDPIHSTPFLQIGRNGDCRIEVAAAGRYLVHQGREVIVQPASGATPAEIGVFLLGSVIGLLCHQRGLFPLHASCVRIGDGAVAFCGESGAGKSTLAASLVLRGHSLLCDDIMLVDDFASGTPVVRPAMPRMRLWRDALDALGVPHEFLPRDRIELQKYVVPVSEIGAFLPESLPLKAIFLLRRASNPSTKGASALAPMESVARLTEQIYRRRQADALGRKAELFRWAGRIADLVPISYLDRDFELGQLEGTAALVEQLVGS